VAKSAIRSPVYQKRIRRLRVARDQAETEWRKHTLICSACHLGVILAREACDEGWAIAIKRAKARSNWANRETLASGNATQGTLFW